MSDNARARSAVASYIYLLWKPLHIPSASSLNITDNKLKAFEIEGGDGIETNIKQNHSPFKEGVYGIRWSS